MAEERDLTFPPFRLELANERLWRGSEPLSLRPKAFRLLRYLAEHPERLLTQEELRKALWQHGYVSDSLLRGYIRQLREVLGDDAKNPRFIETAGGRGYRFIAPLTSTRPVPSFNEASVSPALQPPSPFVGRQEERAHLHEALAQALRGERQVVFVSGEPGISARPRSSIPFWRIVRGPTRVFGSGADSVSSTMAEARPTCRCSRRSGGSRAGWKGKRSSRSCAGRRPPGFYNCPGSWRRPRARR